VNDGAPIPGLEDLFNRSEDLEIEFKSARGGLPKDLWPTVSAFANTRGGWLVLGVEEKDKLFVVRGVPSAEARIQEFWDLLRNDQKISHPVCSDQDVAIRAVNGEDVLVIRIRAVSRKDRPVYINGNPYHGTFVRRHSGDYRCTKPEVDRMIRDASIDATDSTVLPRFTMDDLDPDSFTGYRRRFQTQNPASPWNAYDSLRFLQAVEGYRRNRETGEEGLTVAGLLMFGRPEAIREWRSRHLIDFRRLAVDSDSGDRWIDRVAWDGNLLGAFDAIYPRLVAEQPVPFRLEDGARKGEGPAQVALREAFINLLVHADYAETDVSLVTRSPAGYLFRNPGNSRIPEDDLMAGDRSDPRNPSLAFMFRQIGLAEEAGTGIPKILQAWRELGFRIPEIVGDTERYEFKLELRYAHLLSDDDREWIRSLGESWTEEEQIALVLARHEGTIDNLRLRRIMGIHSADATRVLSGLRNRQLLEPQSGGRWTWYRLTSKAVEGMQVGLGHTRAADEIMDWGRLEDIARPAREKKRLNPEVRDSIVVRLCRDTPLSLDQLSRLLDRSRNSMRDVVQELLNAGQLDYLYPDHPTHPDQRYVAPAKEAVHSGG
jgi:predicted HTH transcriptional regulator